MSMAGFSKEELSSHLEFLLSQYRRVDGFWFLGVENRFGYGAAIEIYKQVWDRTGRLMTREIQQRFGIDQKDLEALVKVMQVYPRFLITRYKIDVNADEVFIRALNCPSQEALLKRGMGEHNRKDMHRRKFESIIKEVDGRISVESLFCTSRSSSPGIVL